MSEPKRYAFKPNEENDFDLVQDPQGVWVSYVAYANLKSENARLKAEVERLTKAGDNLYFDVKARAVNGISIQERNSMRVWEYAKQGGQP